jgi:hypothetical protein
MAFIPAGRGPKDQVGQDEQLNNRFVQTPAQDGWYISTLPGFVLKTAVALGTTDIRLYLLPPLPTGLSLQTARITITTGVAASTVRVGIYQYTADPVRRLVLVPGSEALFDGNVTGQQNVKLQTPLVLPAGAILAIGVAGSSTTIEMAALAANVTDGHAIPSLRTTNSGALAKAHTISALTTGYNAPVFMATYLSVLGAQFL